MVPFGMTCPQGGFRYMAADPTRASQVRFACVCLRASISYAARSRLLVHQGEAMINKHSRSPHAPRNGQRRTAPVEGYRRASSASGSRAATAPPIWRRKPAPWLARSAGSSAGSPSTRASCQRSRRRSVCRTAASSAATTAAPNVPAFQRGRYRSPGAAAPIAVSDSTRKRAATGPPFRIVAPQTFTLRPGLSIRTI